jgi:adenylate cyclase
VATEIERKYLVNTDRWVAEPSQGRRYRQGYICAEYDRVVRVRTVGDEGFVTIKGATQGIARLEFEYAIPVGDAREMLERLCAWPLIEKTRYRVPVAGRTWDVDVFEGENAGLVVAEVELPSADAEVVLPAWAGAEVSADPRYHNANLARRPYSAWRDER